MPALRSPFAGGDLPAADVDPDYLYFLQHVRLDGNSYALELPARGASPPTFIKYEAPPASSDGECVSDPSPGRLSTNRRAEEKDSSASVEGEPAWYDSLGDVDVDYRIFLQHTRLVDGQLVLEIGGAVINYDHPDASRFGGSRDAEKEKGKRRGQEVASPGEMFSVGGEREGVAVGTPATPVPEPDACDWQADPTPGQEDEGPLNAGTLIGAYWEASSSSGRVAGLPAGAVRNSDTSKYSSVFLFLSFGQATNNAHEDQFKPWVDDSKGPESHNILFLVIVGASDERSGGTTPWRPQARRRYKRVPCPGLFMPCCWEQQQHDDAGEITHHIDDKPVGQRLDIDAMARPRRPGEQTCQTTDRLRRIYVPLELLEMVATALANVAPE
ncbi:hypothetical protein PR202_gb14832 [Eleusine coracana subsp. coracana]|uniref:Uncharacterized protein n=1 Tax=Eleusine coracana subsp. coracana TaxID=191504 RepID=A0AAV5EXV1_ELECO|nr:hypothetical protein PR202_gb14832 [Eleusine coracana subsp. coracana]